MAHKILQIDATNRDLIKALAVIIMIIDHVGFYFFPEQEWWRAIGRIGFPVWFFYAGYAQQGRLEWMLWPPMLLLIGAKLLSNMAILPVNALLTIFIIRAMLLLIPKAPPQLEISFMAAGLAILFYPLSNAVMEYGTIGLLFGYLGYVVRNQPPTTLRHILALLTYASFIYTMQAESFNFALPPYIFASIGTAFFMGWLYTSTTKPLSWQQPLLSPLLKALGRHTLFIYATHLTLFPIVKHYAPLILTP